MASFEKRITMTDIAASLGVTKMTVSLALKNDPRLSVATRDRVAARARELGYRPNPLVTALMREIRTQKTSKRSGSTLALIIEGLTKKSPLQVPTYQRILAGIHSQALQQGFQIETFYTGSPDLSDARLNRILHTRGIRGVVLFDFFGDREGELPQLDWNRLAVVAFTHHRPGLPINRVLMDHRANAFLALERLRALGYRRIGLPLGKNLDPGFQYALSSAFLVWRHLHPEFKPVPFLPVDGTKITRDVFLRWVNRHRPDALLTHQAALIGWLREGGYHVPGEVAVALTNLDESPASTGVDSRHEVVGAVAVNVLAAQLTRNEFGPQPDCRMILVPGRWRTGDTTGEADWADRL